MATTVTAPLEVQFGQMTELNRMSSISSGGSSAITLQFDLALPLDVAEQEVQAAINAAASLLPTDLPAPPIYAKVNPADAPILTLALTSRTLPLTEVESLADQQLAQKISQLAGVGLVSISGGQRPAVRMQVNTRQLASYGLTLANLSTAIASANANGAKGNFDGPTRAYSIDANDQLLTAGGLRRADHRLSQRRAGAPLGRRQHRGGLGKHRAGRVVRRHPGDPAQRPAPAGRQCHQHRRPDQEGPARPDRRPAGRDQRHRGPPTAPPASAPRCATWSSSWCSAWPWWWG